MKVLWASDYCFLTSAYGTQTLTTLKWLNGDDRETTVEHQPLAGNHNVLFEPDTLMDFRIWPGETSAVQQQFRGTDTREHFYKGNYDLLVAFKDCLSWLPKMHKSPIPKIMYTPVASDPAPPALFDAAEKWTAVWCPSKNGVEQFEDHGIDATYIPHFVDKSTFQPILPKHDYDVEDLRREAGIGPDDFVVGFVGLNRGERKDIARIVEAFATWRDNYGRENTKLYLHTDPDGSAHGGVNIRQVARKIGLPSDAIKTTDQWKRKVGYTSRGMAKFYNVLDCYLGTERGAGFAVPPLEATACGTPAIVTDHAAMRERIDEGENGYLVEPTLTETNSMTGTNAIPAVDDIAEKLDLVYQRHWDPEAVRDTVIPEFDVQPIIENRMIPALNSVYSDVFVEEIEA